MKAMLLARIAETSSEVAATSSRLAKIERLATCLRSATADEVAVAVCYLSGDFPQGTVGVGWAALRDVPPPTETPTLELLEVDAAVTRLQALGGKGSQAARREELSSLFARATEPEQRLLTGLFLGELRQGALEGVMAEAVAKAAGVPVGAVRRAAMFTGDLAAVAEIAMREGAAGLDRFRLEPLRPVTPMLAQTAEDVGSALARLGGRANVEWKLDGARIQAHRLGNEVRVFTRNLSDISARVPEIVATLGELDVEAIVLDGEAIALRADGRPEPFQVTMSRFGTRSAADETSRALTAFFFDCLHADGRDLVDTPARERLAVLDTLLPPELVVPRIESDDPESAQAFLDDALARGHEGVMVKSLDAPYEAGRRGAGWLKVKQAHTLDLVVLAAEWGHGRRQGKLSNLHLGARDPEHGSFVMLGKTFKGMTDEMLAWQTEHLLGLATEREGHVVRVRPELVVEVAFDGVQTSSRYPGGVALRFARLKGYRPDKSPADADTIETVRAINAHAE